MAGASVLLFAFLSFFIPQPTHVSLDSPVSVRNSPSAGR
jgi:hypothetical protein